MDMEHSFESSQKLAEPIARALVSLGEQGLSVAAHDLNALHDAGFPLDDAQLPMVMIEALKRVLSALADDCRSPVAHAFVDTLSPVLAGFGADLLILSNFPDGNIVVPIMDDALVFGLVALLARAGDPALGADILGQAADQRQTAQFLGAAHIARCRLLALDPSIASLWLDPIDAPSTIDAARFAVALHPLSPATHRVLARRLAEMDDMPGAVAALATGLALPLCETDKLDLASDVAILAAYLCGTGRAALFSSSGMTLALGANPRVAVNAERSLALLDARASALSDLAIDTTRNFLRTFVTGSLSPYPIRSGKPHVDIVWLEITNFCNQKCTFCPDMFREDARTWLPLAEVKRLIDELANTISVGSMQLNAYGEPLLHPNIAEIISYIREKNLPWPTFFTSHGMTLVDKKLSQLSHNYPTGIAISLHNDSQSSYEATRSAKIGDYETLVTRVSALLEQMAVEGAACHLRLYQMVCNGAEDKQVDAATRAAFPDTVDRMTRHVRKWEAIASAIAARAPGERRVKALVNDDGTIAASFYDASHGEGIHLPILSWMGDDGQTQTAFISPRPVGTYANLLLEYDANWHVERKLVTGNPCTFVASPSLAIFATGRLGICCMDLNSTATFGSLSDYPTLRDALTSPEAVRMFAELSNGIATSRGCQICLGSGQRLCGDRNINPASSTKAA